jgi:1,2-diacylglycerol 3-alpha-glucosyltransferase
MRGKPRVGIFTNAYQPLISGVVNSIELTRKELLRQGWSPWIFAPQVAGYRDRHAGVARYPSLEVTRQVQYPLALPYWPRWQQRLARLKPQILHVHHPFLLGETAYFWARRQGVPLVYTFHTQYEQYCHYVPWLPQRPLKALVRWAVGHYARRCDLIIAPSSGIEQLLRDYGIRVRTEVVPNAIDLAAFTNQVSCRSQLGWPPGVPMALYAGRLGKEKNLVFLLRCLAQVPEAHLAIVGDGPERGSLQELGHHLGLTSRLHFCGRVNYRDMPRYYASADFFAMSSTTEVKPLVVLEALAAGLPVLAVAACGTADTLSHEQDGLLVPERSPDFCAAWERLAYDPHLRERLSQGARRTAAQYSITQYTARLIELYQELLARPNAR